MQGTTITRERFRLDSVDDALGDRQGRFFGEGFKRVTQGLSAITVRPAGASAPGTVDADAGIRIPGVWSRKGESHQRPHLSTIDAMQFAAQLTGLYAAHVHELPPTGHFVVRSLCIKAGCTPDEESLDRFPVSALHESTRELPGTDRLLTTMDCRIGSMTVRVEAEHSGSAATVRTEGSYAHPEYLPGVWNDAPYGASHHGRHQYLLDVAGAADSLSADAELRITEALQAPDALDGAAPEPLEPTMVDLFVASLQLGQVLLYRLDGLDRATSNTLWMRGTTIAPAEEPAGEPAERPAADRRLRVVLARPNELPTAEGTWRAARIQATYGGLSLSCNVAHLLP
ncbi:AvrD family protein [Streptomyces sp. NPDC087300]|uniref:AvrD family protein n=1 Tax=Streptomyces sp. NPDC087300 TaxID=3365780 RepID=UPI003828C2A0